MRESSENIALIQMALSLVILGVLYKKMLGWEVPEPVGKKQAIAPIVFGALSVPLSFMFVLVNGGLVLVLGFDLATVAQPFQALLRAFLSAALPEEITKFLFILLSIKLFRPKNAYEYILIGGAVGFGFTVLEDFLYGGDTVAFIRILTLALHVVFDMIMAKYLAMARYKKIKGDGATAREYALALVIPIALHTIYDACTVLNPVVKEIEEGADISLPALIVTIAVALCIIVYQFIFLIQFKKKSKAYCDMILIPDGVDSPAA